MSGLPHLPALRSTRNAARAALAVLSFAFLICLPGLHGLQAAPREGGRAVFVVRLPSVPAWQDFAFLAMVPAATVRCDGAPAVIALDESGAITREMDDYLSRYKPQALYCLGPLPREAASARRQWHALDADSADAAAGVLARTFWKSADTAVVCREGDYGMALVASALAARLRSPLFFSTAESVPAGTAGVLKDLAVKKAIVVGLAPKAAAALKETGLAVVDLKDASAVLAWMREQKIAASYFAVVNPLDREATVIKKLSLAAPLLAAARQGIVVPLSYKTLWKTPFIGAECKASPPKGTPESRKPPRMGLTTVNGHPFAFVVTSGKNDKDYRAVNVDMNGNGDFSEAGEGPFRTGDTVTLGGQRYSLTLGEKNGLGKADVRLIRTSALDVSIQAQILNLLRELQERFQLTYLFITHNLGMVEYVADEVAVMYLGRIVEQCLTESLFDEPLHPYTQALLSAIPRADPLQHTQRIRLEGDVPSPIAPPPGCHFHPRCRYAMMVCRSVYPNETRLRGGRIVRCHLYEGRTHA